MIVENSSGKGPYTLRPKQGHLKNDLLISDLKTKTVLVLIIINQKTTEMYCVLYVPLKWFVFL